MTGKPTDGGTTTRPKIAVFRPADDRMDDAVELLSSLGATPIPDPMLAVEPTGVSPEDPDGTSVVIFTSKTGVELASRAGWKPTAETSLVVIGPATAAAARDVGWTVDTVPEEYTSAGLVEAVRDRVRGERVEVARSDHGSDVLLRGLREAGAVVTETVLYRLIKPPDSGESAELAARGELDAVAFTSSMTVENFLAAADERDVHDAALAGVNDAVVGAIGPPTAETAERHGIDVDTVPENAAFDELARRVVDATRKPTADADERTD